MTDEGPVVEELLDLCRYEGATSARLGGSRNLLQLLGVSNGAAAWRALNELLPENEADADLRVLRWDLNLKGGRSKAKDRRQTWGSENTAKKYERRGAEKFVARLRARASASPSGPVPHQIALDDIYRPRRPVLRFEGQVLINMDADLVCRSAHVKTRLVESDFLDGWPWPGSKDEWWEGESPPARLRLSTSRKLDELALNIIWKRPPALLFAIRDNATTASVFSHLETRTDVSFQNVAFDVNLYIIEPRSMPRVDLHASLTEHNRKIAERDALERAIAERSQAPGPAPT